MKTSRIVLASAVVGGACGLAAFGPACTSTTCEDTSTCSPSGEGGTMDSPPSDHSMPSDARHDGHVEGSADGPVSEGGDTGPAACPSTATPATNACSISEAFGVFVAPAVNGGSDSGDGSRKHPYATFATAIPKAVAAGLRVYACGSTTVYAEKVAVGSTTDGVGIYGGLECPVAGDGGVADAGTVDSSMGPWSYTGVAAAVAPTVTGYALDVESVSKGAHFEDVSFTALAANVANPGESSIGVMVNNSSNVEFVRATTVAGNGSNGAPGGALASNMCVSSLNGSSTASSAGGLQGACTDTATPGNCPVYGSSAGAVGGGGGIPGAVGGNGSSTPTTTLMVVPFDGSGGAGANSVDSFSCANAHAGANGSAQGGGAAGEAGSLKASGWQPASAPSGSAGNPGQGGGGGGGNYGALALGGAGGAAGGCGGNGGGGGGGGGASLAMAVVKSTVNCTAITLQTGTGGQGGMGGQGEQGQAGGSGGSLGASECFGGNGGQGAGGSGGGGGAGGPSVGIGLASGGSVKIDGASVTTAATLTGMSTFSGGLGGSLGGGGLAGEVAPGGGGNPGQPGSGGTAGLMGAAAAVTAL
jgi:hypothetical protein